MKNKLNLQSLCKSTDRKHSLILGKPKLKVINHDFNQSKEKIVKKYKDHFFPLALLKNMDIEEYTVNNPASKPIKLPKFITEDLCKIWGALAADGHISTKSKADYIIQITDGDFSAITSFQRWFENCFGIKPRIIKYKRFNAWRICINNKIIGRFIVDILKFPVNKKSSTVKVPSFLNTNLKIKAFLIGVFTFDAGVDLNGNIEYSIYNKHFFKAVNNLLQKLNINFKHSGKADGNNFWRFHTYKLCKDDLIKWSELFERNTEKWNKIIDLIHDYNKIPISEEEVLFAFNNIYPPKNASKMTLTDIYSFIKINKLTTISKISQYLNIKGDTTIKYREVLKKCNIITEEVVHQGESRIKIKFNNDLNSWKIPWREHYDKQL